MEIFKMMVMSTGHISKETASMLNLEIAGVVVYQKDEYGWFVVVTEWQENEEIIPDDLKKCLSLAQENGCDWLCLDCDGNEYPELPIFKW